MGGKRRGWIAACGAAALAGLAGGLAYAQDPTAPPDALGDPECTIYDRNHDSPRVGRSLAEVAERSDRRDASGQPNVRNEDDYYDLMTRDLPLFEAVLDNGSGVDSRIGAQVHRTLDTDDIAAARARPHVLLAPLKGRARAREKVENKYRGDWGRLRDGIRGTVLVPKVNQLCGAISATEGETREQGWKVANLENRFTSEKGSSTNTGPTEDGYRDVSMNLVGPDGVKTELQINTIPMFIAKETKAHSIYERVRTIRERIKAENREATPRERRQLQEASDDSKRLFGDALEDSR